MILRSSILSLLLFCVTRADPAKQNEFFAFRDVTSDGAAVECSNNAACAASATTAAGIPQESTINISGTASLKPLEGDQVAVSSQLSVTKTSIKKCLGLEGAANLTQTQLINRLTAPCRYDRLEHPTILNADNSSGPVKVHVRIYMYSMQNEASNALQLKMHGLLQVRYNDPRLAFGKYAPQRHQPILGEGQLRELIWVPHLFLANEHDSTVLGTNEKDILTSIAGDGTVIISSRIKASLYCWMNLMKFPFDEQYCTTLLESWMYNTSELILHWENNLPIAFDPKLHLTEYALMDAWCNESMVNADEFDMRHGAFAGSYSSLNFTVYLVRESGYYVMDYFLPSMMIVAISWVTFWLQADQTPARTTLGTSTMLSFITLASSQDKNLPKVSYIKISEIWFLGCTLFIFSSLVEFAFVNAIWRRNLQNIALKKVSSKHILKSTLKPRRKSDAERGHFSSYASSSYSLNASTVDSNANIEEAATQQRQTWSTMTSQEVALWIDRKARFAFPLAFIIFNAIFWMLVYCL